MYASSMYVPFYKSIEKLRSRTLIYNVNDSDLNRIDLIYYHVLEKTVTINFVLEFSVWKIQKP